VKYLLNSFEAYPPSGEEEHTFSKAKTRFIMS